MLVKEFRIPMPITSEEYKIGQTYYLNKGIYETMADSVKNVKIVKNENISTVEGEGVYYMKEYSVNDALPYIIRSVCTFEKPVIEEMWNYYPYVKTSLYYSGSERFSVNTYTYYNDGGYEEPIVYQYAQDVPKDLDSEIIDLSKHTDANEKDSVDEDVEESVIHPGWLDRYRSEPEKYPKMMCTYKLVIIKAILPIISKRVEGMLLDHTKKTIMASHNNIWKSRKKWRNLTLEEAQSLKPNIS